MSNLFTSALSAMNAAQTGMATTQHNIANASTPGFTRQTVVTSPNAGQMTGGGFIGAGVEVSGVRRIYDQYLTNQVRLEQTQSNYLSTYHSSMTQIDNLIADPTAGASPAMQDFFNALNGVANNPESVPARQTLLGTSQFVVNRFQAIDQRLTDIADGLNGQITRSIGTVNNYAQQIATLNGNIKRAIANGQGQLPNDLLDQRDQVINQLNQEIKVSVQLQPDGAANVYVGNGQTLVIDEKSMNLGAIRSETDPSKLDIVYRDGANTTLLQQTGLQGGNLGAYLAFRDQSLEPARNALGRVAMGLATKMNEQNQMGLDLNGAAGGNIFNVGAPRVETGIKNTGTAVASATISDVTQLTTSDYQLRYDGANYSMVRLSDNTSTNVGTTAAPPSNVTMDGFTFSVSAGAIKGDTFLIRPTADGARDIRVTMSNPANIAAAAPVRSNADLTNTGSGIISAPVVTSGLPLNVNLQSPVTLTFNDPPTTYSQISSNAMIAVGGTDVTVASTTNMAVGMPITGGGFPAGATITSITNGTTFVASVAGTPGVGQTLKIGSYAYTSGNDISFNGWTAQISGTPAAGDVFTVGANTNATGDNRNALLMSGMQNQNLMADGTTTFQGIYGQLVGEIGAKTHELAVTSQAQISMTAQSVAQQQAVSGVNLDEEAANLMLYQRAYQAAAKAMQVANTMFDALMAIGG
ncbi:MAG: flagellar hook-associated protein FlgK [Gallionella sp.]|nr:flagellar hook-associated protein FlgK [Gallionella sp.]